MNHTKSTPMMRQYLSIKDKYPDTVLLYRMGDFYEMFFDDAKEASHILEIVLTSRNKNDTDPIPMCGFPYRSAHGYIAKLIGSGRKVAICDQVSDPSKSKGLVERKVIRVITPGMVIDDDFLDEKVNNFILALNYYRKSIGLAFLDISTGDFFVTESFCFSDIINEVGRIDPSEILIPKYLKKTPLYKKFSSISFEGFISFTDNNLFDYTGAHKFLVDRFLLLSLESLGCDHMYAGVGAAGALIKYVNETQKQELEHLKPIKPYHLDDFLIVDRQSRKNLELFDAIRSSSKNETLINVLDCTMTPMGGRLLNNWMRYPLIDQKQIQQRQDAVNEAVDNVKIRKDIRKVLRCIYDLERLASKISIGSANARDLNALKKSIQFLPNLFRILPSFTSKLYAFDGKLNTLYSLEKLLEKSIRNDAPIFTNEGGIIQQGFNKTLDELISVAKNGRNWLANLESQEKKQTGINSLKVRYNKVFGYYIEIPKRQSKNVPKHYVCKQTLVNAERYTIDSLKEFEAKIFTAENQRVSLEFEIFENIRSEIKKHNRKIQDIAHFISIIDCITCFAAVAHKNNYCKPSLNLEGSIKIESGRHPVVERLMNENRFVPNSIEMDNNENQILIITGPNMAGKSTILRQTALCVIMAQMGSFIPAKKANISIIDRIFTRVGALDNLAAGQSTFMVEMQETANILNNATKNSLILIDEIGRGTSTFDGLSIAWSIAEYLHDLDGGGVKSMFATHYHELTNLEKYKSKIKNYNVAAKEVDDEVIFMRQLIRGSTNKSYGIQVARLAGMPEYIIERAKNILLQLGSKSRDLKVGTAIDDKEQKKFEKTEVILNQLDKQKKIISMLQNVDIMNMNPIEALNYLNELQIKAKIIF